jgi:hypothetical protein
VVKGGVPKEVGFQVLAEPGKQYAIYLRSTKNVALEIDLPKGNYEGEWLDAVSGQKKAATLHHDGGVALIKPPEFPQDCALQLIASQQ